MRDNQRVGDIDLAALQLARRARMMEYELKTAEWEQKVRRTDALFYFMLALAIGAAAILLLGVDLKWW